MIALEGIPLVPGSAQGAAMTVRPSASIMPDHTSGTDRQRIADARHAAESDLRRRLEMLPDGPARHTGVVLLHDGVYHP